MSMLLAAWRLFAAAVRFVLDKLRQCFDWLRKEGNGVKAVAGVLALVSFGMLLSLQATRSTLQGERLARTAERQQFEIALQEKDAAIAGYQQQIAQFAEFQRRQTEALKRAQAASAEALAEYERKQAKSQKSNRQWWQVYEGRTDVCKAAQEALDVACKEIKAL